MGQPLRPGRRRLNQRVRIIAGTHRGRRLDAPDWPGLRPTSDRLRETLFNILAPRMPDATVLDGCAGTGAVGIEALSRGAAHVTFVDQDRRAAALVSANLQRCGITEGYAIIRADLGHFQARLPQPAYDVIFLDPPYTTDPAPLAGAVSGFLAPGGVLVIEHATRRHVPDQAGALGRVRTVRSGDSTLSFFAGDALGSPGGLDDPQQ